MTGENDRVPRGAHRNLLVREDPVDLFGRSAHIYIDSQIEAARAFQFIPDEQRNFAGSATVHQNLGWSNWLSISNRRISDRHALQPLCGVDQQGLAYEDAQR